MAKNHYRSLTISEATFNKLQKTFDDNKVELGMMGITSPTGLFCHIIEQGQRDSKQWKKFASKIEIVPITYITPANFKVKQC